MKFFRVFLFVLVLVFTPITLMTSCQSTYEMESAKPNEQFKNGDIQEDKNAEDKNAEAEKENKAKVNEETAIEENEVLQEQQEKLAKQFQLEYVVVARAIDGDTVELGDGRKVRLIGVNTPESTTRNEEYGKEASLYTKSKLIGKWVWIQKDVSEVDRYHRLLRIVWLAIPTNDQDEEEIRKKMFNADLVLQGYAEPSTYPPDVKYSELFIKFAREARERNIGLWSYGDTGTTRGDLDFKEDGSKEGTTNSSKKTFPNCTELRKVYPKGVPYDHPAYSAKHDRDKDNWACERS